MKVSRHSRSGRFTAVKDVTIPFEQEAGLVPEAGWTYGEKKLLAPCGNRSPDHPAHKAIFVSFCVRS